MTYQIGDKVRFVCDSCPGSLCSGDYHTHDIGEVIGSHGDMVCVLVNDDIHVVHESVIDLNEASDTPSIEEIKQAFDDVIWMAIRYAHGRSTYAPGMVRDACGARAKFGDFQLKEDDTLEDIYVTPVSIKDDDLRDLIELYGRKLDE